MRVQSKSLSIMAGAAFIFSSVGARAQEQPAPEDPLGFVVVGLAPDDLLNLRATASATGMLIARVPAGTLLRGHGCAKVRSIRWCKVSDVEDPKVMGWAADRYLRISEVDFSPAPEPEVQEEPGEMIGPVEGETPPR